MHRLLIKCLTSFRERTSIRKKILILFVPAVVAFIILFGSFANGLYERSLTELTSQYLDQLTISIEKDLRSRVTALERLSLQTAADPSLRDILERHTGTGKSPIELFDDSRELDQNLARVNADPNDLFIRLYMIESNLPPDGWYTLSRDKFPRADMLSRVLENGGRSTWMVIRERPTMIAVARVLFASDSSTPLAVLTLESPVALLVSSIRSNLEPGTAFGFRLILASGEKTALLAEEGFYPVQNSLIRSISIGPIIHELGYDERVIARLRRNLGRSLWGLTSLFSLCFVVTSVGFSRIVNSRISRFVSKLEPGAKPSAPITGTDEVALIDRRFENLIDQLHKTASAEKTLLGQKHEVEAELLMAQINPHFLYNTLSAVRWSVLRHGDQETANVLDRLVIFYRTSLSGGRPVVTVARELEIVQSYLDIYRYTYDREVSLAIECPQYCLDILCPKCILQPIIENALVHGKSANGGAIAIRICFELCAMSTGEALSIRIEDNGPGLSPELAHALSSSDKNPFKDGTLIIADRSNAGGSGFGIRNATYRLRTFASGDPYALDITPMQSSGTVVKITLPVRR